MIPECDGHIACCLLSQTPGVGGHPGVHFCSFSKTAGTILPPVLPAPSLEPERGWFSLMTGAPFPTLPRFAGLLGRRGKCRWSCG